MHTRFDCHRVFHEFKADGALDFLGHGHPTARSGCLALAPMSYIGRGRVVSRRALRMSPARLCFVLALRKTSFLALGSARAAFGRVLAVFNMATKERTTSPRKIAIHILLIATCATSLSTSYDLPTHEESSTNNPDNTTIDHGSTLHQWIVRPTR